MTEQSPLSNDEDIWDELLNSEASQRYLEERIKEAGKLLEEQKK